MTYQIAHQFLILKEGARWRLKLYYYFQWELQQFKYETSIDVLVQLSISILYFYVFSIIRVMGYVLSIISIVYTL